MLSASANSLVCVCRAHYCARGLIIPCRVGLMPAMLGLVCVAVWTDPQPQSRAQHWPTSCCKHLRHHTAAWVPVCIYIYVCTDVCMRYMYLWVYAKPQHKTGHLYWTTVFWTWSRALWVCQLQTARMNSLICRCHAVYFTLYSCSSVKSLVLLFIMTDAETISWLLDQQKINYQLFW